MKHLLTLLLALLATVALQAQNLPVATLNHEGEISVFYSANAFKDAHTAAVDGDVITLSAGAYVACDITKNITMRGAGMLSGENPTILTGNFDIKITSSDSGKSLYMEGVISNGTVTIRKVENPNFVKCKFKKVSYGSSTPYPINCQFLHCMILNIYSYGETASYINSVVLGYSGTRSMGYSNFINSYITCTSASYTNFHNCIIESAYKGSTYTLDTSSYATNSYYIGNAGFFKSIEDVEPTNHEITEEITPFKEGTLYELTDELATTWLGSDGTQVGIYGGAMPFDPATSYPQITKFNVATKTTADGKLPVDIEVKAEENAE